MSDGQATWFRWGIDTLIGVLVVILSASLCLVWGEVKSTQASVRTLEETTAIRIAIVTERAAAIESRQAVVIERLDGLRLVLTELKQELKDLRADLAKNPVPRRTE